MQDCIFCKIIDYEKGWNNPLYENDSVLVIWIV